MVLTVPCRNVIQLKTSLAWKKHEPKHWSLWIQQLIPILNSKVITKLLILYLVPKSAEEHKLTPIKAHFFRIFGTWQWPQRCCWMTREIPNITIYQFEKGFCRSHTFAGVSCWVMPLCREIPFGVVRCFLCWFRCRLSHSLTWECTGVAWENSQALEECRLRKNCLVPGDLGQANSQILQDSSWSRSKLLQELLLM